MTALRLLDLAQVSIMVPTDWCKSKSGALDAHGNQADPSSLDAFRWTAVGAIIRQASIHDPRNEVLHEALDELHKTARKLGFFCALSYNDHPATDHNDVMRLFWKALKNAA